MWLPLSQAVISTMRSAAQKKIPQTDAIFQHLRSVHTSLTNQPQTLRISIDTKAKVKIGPFSRGGYARSRKAVSSLDHDTQPQFMYRLVDVCDHYQMPLELAYYPPYHSKWSVRLEPKASP